MVVVVERDLSSLNVEFSFGGCLFLENGFSSFYNAS